MKAPARQAVRDAEPPHPAAPPGGLALTLAGSPRQAAGRRRIERTFGPGAVVQRRVGFEFEDGKWEAWRQGYFSRLYPAERKAQLHTGTGYALEADDTPGPKSSNLEFVTDPFDETAAGLQALEVTLGQISALVHGRLDGLVGAPGPQDKAGDPPYTLDATRVRSQAQHQLTGPAYGGGRWLHLSGGKAGGSFKMQATAGAALADLPRLMETFGSQVPNETGAEKAERDPARATLAGSADAAAASAIQRVIGGSPTVAADALLRLQGDAAFTLAERATLAGAGAADLRGLLSAVVLTMKMMQLPIDGVLKYRVPLMFRTDFSQLFGALAPAVQAALQAHPDALARCIVQASNAAPLLPRVQGVDPDSGLTVGSPLIRPPLRPTWAPTVALPHEAFGGITIGLWVAGFTAGTDYLTPGAADAWLSAQGWWWWSRRDKTALVESFGSVGALDRNATHGTRALAVFESRAIAPKGGGGNLSVEEASKLAWNQLLFYKRIEDLREGGPAPGTYPDEDVGQGA